MRDWRQYRLSRELLKAELRAAHEAGPDAFLSDTAARVPPGVKTPRGLEHRALRELHSGSCAAGCASR